MRIAVVGAGAIGCLLGARLSEAGHEVTLVGRGAQVEAINRDGLLVREARRGARRYALAAVEAVAERPELALLTVKTQDVEAACRASARALAGAPVIALQNGLRGDALAAGVLGREAVVGGVVMCAASYLRPGEVSVDFAGWLILGEPFRASLERVRALARIMAPAIPTYVTAHLERARWSKLISNLNNGICAATGLPLPLVAQAPLGRALAVRVMREGYRVARAAGVRLDHGLYGLSPRALRQDRNAALVALLQSTMTGLLAIMPDHAAEGMLALASRSRLGRLPVRGSTWQSIARGRPSEIEYLNGEIVRLGGELGVPTPYNTRLIEVLREVERTGEFQPLESLAPPTIAQAAHVGPIGGAA
jgi:2-dehydropantoate 2-reductase